MRILITDGQQRKSLAATRSLGKNGDEIFVAENTRFNPTAYSKYCSKFIKSPDIHDNEVEYYKWLLQTLEKYNIDMLIPMDDLTMKLAVKKQIELKDKVLLLVPEISSYIKASDKGFSTENAIKNGVPSPITYFPKDYEDFEEQSTKMSFPVVIKPRISSGSRGIKAVKNRILLLEEYKKTDLKHEAPIIQEFLKQGVRYDVCFLFNEDGEIIAEFTQKELRHFPEPMGPSTVQESIYMPELVALAKKVMHNIPWKGIAELEFMQDPDTGEMRFMEINTRFWASLELSIYAGVNFPVLLRNATLKESGGKKHDSIINEYKIGLKCIWRLPSDTIRTIFVERKGKLDPPFFSNEKSGVKDDIIDKNDLMPTLGFILACFRYLFDIKTWKLFFFR